jgi:hypothetical protein
MNAEMMELLKAFEEKLAPMVDAAVKSAVAIAAPAVAPIVAPIIDAVDALVIGMSGGTAPPTATPAPTDTDSRLAALEQHVAALTISTGHGGSAAMVANKAAVQAVANAPQT